jgi:GldM C-terminal domain
MKSININKILFSSFQTVAFLAIVLFSSTVLNAQEVSLRLLKGDALFIGVENLVQVTVPGIPSENIYIGSDGVDIEKMDNGIFKLGLHYPGKTTLTVHGEGFKYKNFDFEVKRIPDPLTKLPDPVASMRFSDGTFKTDGELTAMEFKKAVGLSCLVLDNTIIPDYGIASYSIVRVPSGGDPAEVFLHSADFNYLAKSLVAAAAPGDTYYVEKVMATVKSETEPRQVNSLVFHIK